MFLKTKLYKEPQATIYLMLMKDTLLLTFLINMECSVPCNEQSICIESAGIKSNNIGSKITNHTIINYYTIQ